MDAWAQMGDDPAEGSLEPCKATGTESPLGPFLPFTLVFSLRRDPEWGSHGWRTRESCP